MKGKQKTLMLKIIIILIVVLTVDVFAPFATSNAGFFGALGEWVGKRLFDAISRFLANISDTVIQNLQKLFVGSRAIKDGIIEANQDIKYSIKYSPRYNIFWNSSSF